MSATFRASEPGASDAVLISSRRNPLVRTLRQLHTAAGRREQGLMLVEGTHLAQEVQRLALLPAHVLCTETWQQRHPALLAGLLAHGKGPGQATLVSDAVLAAIATTEHPDGVVLTLEPPAAATPSALSFGLVLDGIQDPGNLGTLLRTALAAGIEQVWLAGGADPLQPKVLRASAGAALALPCWRAERADVVAQIAAVARRGMQVIATVPPAAGVIAYWQLDWRSPTLLLLGAEGPGLSEALLDQASTRVCVPHSDSVESLNVAVAAAPLLLERTRQERMPGN